MTGNPDDFGLLKIEKGHETFEKSFEGLRFILSKDRNKEIVELVNKVFYPKTHVGEEVDFAVLDFDNLPDDFTFESNATYYNDPGTIAAISTFLDTVSIDNFEKLFDHNELNENDIYPEGVWNTETSDGYAFNQRHMTEEFKNLKELFSKAKLDEDYLLSYVG